jgi:hypothetical protein
MENLEIETPSPSIDEIKSFERAEWVFQFDDEEPVVFAWSNDPSDPGEINISLKPDPSSRIIFTDKEGKRKFSLYSREISKDTIKMIEDSKNS